MTGALAAAAYATLHGPTAASLCKSLPGMADGLHAQLSELHALPSSAAAETLAANLSRAQRTVLRLARALREGGGDGR